MQCPINSIHFHHSKHEYRWFIYVHLCVNLHLPSFGHIFPNETSAHEVDGRRLWCWQLSRWPACVMRPESRGWLLEVLGTRKRWNNTWKRPGWDQNGTVLSQEHIPCCSLIFSFLYQLTQRNTSRL